ncbi:hypothetical protein H2198_005978 [Neophaeococcomyces mojaviensis]|uniref:Uncharacterized protein n=1 Tax=Neophaeococcomyces mojaviensis TaxID=3383035 RepID=A0ACC3A4J1_9EURO|nr:hypothetical protein H2198_005978 [Knufia sp. JES_112]
MLTWNSQNEHNLIDSHTDAIPRCAILSYTWAANGDEVTFADLQQGRNRNRAEYAKIRFCGPQAKEDGIEHF